MTPEEDEKLAETGALVVVDEAYIEFVESLNSAVSPAKAGEASSERGSDAHVVKMGWFTGLRISYALAHPTIVSYDDSEAALQRQLYYRKGSNESTRDEGGTRQQPWIQRIQGSRWGKAVAAKAAGKGMVEPYANGSKFCPLPGEEFDAKSVASVLGSHVS